MRVLEVGQMRILEVGQMRQILTNSKCVTFSGHRPPLVVEGEFRIWNSEAS